MLGGFSQNGLQIRNQRIFLRIVAPVKIDFRHFSIFIFFERHDATDATTRRRDDATTILTILTIL